MKAPRPAALAGRCVAVFGVGWLLSRATAVAAHGGVASGEAGVGSGLSALPTWLGATAALALVALCLLVVGRATGRSTRAVGSVAAVLLLGALLVAVVGVTGVGLPGGPAAESPMWESDTARPIGGNHHAPAVADGRVYAPLSGPGTDAGCELVALRGGDGNVVWRAPVETNCTIHAVADPAVADTNGDGEDEIVVATATDDLRTYSRDGALLGRTRLANYGYTRPSVVDLGGPPGVETVVVDVRGTVVVTDSEGGVLWRHPLDDYVWARPVVGDVDGDGAGEVFVAQRDGTLTLLDGATGEVTWTRAVGDDPVLSWVTSGQSDDDAALELVVAGFDGSVYAVDGATGEVTWRRDVGSRAAVGGFGDGDGDGAAEVYAVDNTGTVRALDAATGERAWSTRVTEQAVQMMPPPSLGDTDGDERPDLVVPAHDGTVSKLDPSDGHVVARYERAASAEATNRGFDRIFARTELGDVDGDGDADVIVVHADGTVVALDF